MSLTPTISMSDVPARLLRIHRTPEVAADPPEPVHAYPHRHACSSLLAARGRLAVVVHPRTPPRGTGVAPSRHLSTAPAPTATAAARDTHGCRPRRGRPCTRRTRSDQVDNPDPRDRARSGQVRNGGRPPTGQWASGPPEDRGPAVSSPAGYPRRGNPIPRHDRAIELRALDGPAGAAARARARWSAHLRQGLRPVPRGHGAGAGARPRSAGVGRRRQRVRRVRHGHAGGHARPRLRSRCSRRCARRWPTGCRFTRPTELELAAAEDFLRLVPGADMVKFCKNASDATSAALRLARAATGRELVALCRDQPYFSSHDWFVGTLPINAGMPRGGPIAGARLRLQRPDVAAAVLDGTKAGRLRDPGGRDGAGRAGARASWRACARCATGTAPCWSSTRRSPASAGRPAGPRPSTGSPPTCPPGARRWATASRSSALAGRRELMELGRAAHRPAAGVPAVEHPRRRDGRRSPRSARSCGRTPRRTRSAVMERQGARWPTGSTRQPPRPGSAGTCRCSAGRRA